MKIYNVKSDSVVIEGEYPFHEELKEELLPLLENYPDQQDRSTNVQATMTEWKWQEDNRRVKRLKKYICAETCCPKTCNDIYNRYKESDNSGFPFEFECEEFWANIYNKRDYTHPHVHTGYKFGFGFVYFLKTKWYHPSLVFSESGKKMKPKEGTYIIFPKNLMHHVPKNRFDETRITLSGNLIIKKP